MRFGVIVMRIIHFMGLIQFAYNDPQGNLKHHL